MENWQYENIMNTLQIIAQNQVTLSGKIDALQGDVTTIINNQLITGRDQDKLIKSVNEIKDKIKKS